MTRLVGRRRLLLTHDGDAIEETVSAVRTRCRDWSRAAMALGGGGGGGGGIGACRAGARFIIISSSIISGGLRSIFDIVAGSHSLSRRFC